MPLDPVLLEIIACPSCHGRLDVDEAAQEITCTRCGLVYPINDGVPALLVDEARKPDPKG